MEETEVMTKSKIETAVSTTIHHFLMTNEFYGTMLQNLSLSLTHHIPTAAIGFNEKVERFEVYINPDFFLSLPLEQRIGVFHHEILHFTNSHLFRLPFVTASKEDRDLYNIAGDMSINQYIKHLPKDCIDVSKWVDKNNNPFPLLKSMEDYYLLIRDSQEQNKKLMGEGENPGEQKVLDQHMWDQLPEETKEKMLAEAKKLIKRTLSKTSQNYSNDKGIQDLLDTIDVLLSGINYKAIIRSAIKRTVSSVERAGTWNRPNRRYGHVAPGTTVGKLPKLFIPIDTSGSVSVTELNGFLSIMDGFLKAGSRECRLGLWHTEMYLNKRYKLSHRLNKSEVQSGGTDINCVFEEIIKQNPNLTIILTDGYYGNAHKIPSSEIIWIISKGGCANHPYKNVGRTILLDNLT